MRSLLHAQTSVLHHGDLHFSAQIRGLEGCSEARAAQPKVEQVHLRSLLDLFLTRKQMGVSRKLYE